jgi:hypothetical protein
VLARGRRFALKQYFATEGDRRDRLATEVDALELMAGGGVVAIPRVIAVDHENNCVAMTWIDGVVPGNIRDTDIDQALAFLTEVHGLVLAPAFPPTRLASEACLYGAELERQIDTRLQRLRALAGSEPALGAFLHGRYAPALTRMIAQAKGTTLDFNAPLSQERRTLVAADFGFHNALRRLDGSLVFVDFEYFGWDDPVKLTADILLHPGSTMGAVQGQRFRRGAEALFGADPSFGLRLATLYPLFGLRWVLILLNEFLPDRWHRRLLAGEGSDWAEAKARQLGRAVELLNRVEHE